MSNLMNLVGKIISGITDGVIRIRWGEGLGWWRRVCELDCNHIKTSFCDWISKKIVSISRKTRHYYHYFFLL